MCSRVLIILYFIQNFGDGTSVKTTMTVMSHRHHGVSIPWQPNCSFTAQLIQVKKQREHQNTALLAFYILPEINHNNASQTCHINLRIFSTLCLHFQPWFKKKKIKLIKILLSLFIKPDWQDVSIAWASYNDVLNRQQVIILNLNVRDRVFSVSLCQYHGCWYPNSLLHQDISIHDIDYVK